jgi:hypothetical protein
MPGNTMKSSDLQFGAMEIYGRDFLKNGGKPLSGSGCIRTNPHWSTCDKT